MGEISDGAGSLSPRLIRQRPNRRPLPRKAIIVVSIRKNGRYPLIHTDSIAAQIAKLPTRSIVGIDGVDGSGKTTVADKLAPIVESLGRSVLRASVDGFHNPREVRYSRGRQDPLGYFLDSFDYSLLLDRLIKPFKDGSVTVETRAFDYRTDSPASETEAVSDPSVLILDGIFLHRDEVFPFLDFSIFLNVAFDISFKRLASRDGFHPDPKADSNSRYYSGQLIYFEKCNPVDRATLVLDNSD
ncbi:MAG TPA: hypothetical protein PLI43_20200 [Albidovulum sp.]|uniref:hypothetical protein n=1 Tax=Albidovulum sp. TaxID=1872424 RepID=UPI002CE9B2A2|nr:hypothetical protein [Albidovulum sp.]